MCSSSRHVSVPFFRKRRATAFPRFQNRRTTAFPRFLKGENRARIVAMTMATMATAPRHHQRLRHHSDLRRYAPPTQRTSRGTKSDAIRPPAATRRGFMGAITPIVAIRHRDNDGPSSSPRASPHNPPPLLPPYVSPPPAHARETASRTTNGAVVWFSSHETKPSLLPP